MTNLPIEVLSSRSQITEASSIAILDKIQFCLVSVPFAEDIVLTSYVDSGNPKQLILNQEQASSAPILLLHGFDSSLLEFRRLFPLLAPYQQTWAMDLFGFGLTERLEDITVNTQAIKDHLYSFWQTAIAKPIILVGASMGGAAAIDFALTYPEVVHKLILIGSAGIRAGTSLGKFLVTPFDRMATNFLRNPNVRREVSLKAYANPQFVTADADACASLHLAMPRWSEALISFTRSGGYSSFVDELRYLKPPTLILWGDRDRILGTKDAYKFQSLIPNNQLVWIENSGHVPHLECHETTAQAILNFIQNSD
ncbi:MAG: alpha/beta hydrolase [Pseudanabaenaceae cyanobacterium bins.39]|nr:alpha/beta hydrolase [Pseudanabaenaceae cyanobacterium bins.39]